jgi:hypothetical protein
MLCVENSDHLNSLTQLRLQSRRQTLHLENMTEIAKLTYKFIFHTQ